MASQACKAQAEMALVINPKKESIMKKLVVYTIALSALMLSANAEARHHEEGEGSRKGGMFQRLDSNKDGVVTQDEFLVHAKEKFKKMDSNGDGSVTKDEAKSHHKSRREGREKRRDDK